MEAPLSPDVSPSQRHPDPPSDDEPLVSPVVSLSSLFPHPILAANAPPEDAEHQAAVQRGQLAALLRLCCCLSRGHLLLYVSGDHAVAAGDITDLSGPTIETHTLVLTHETTRDAFCSAVARAQSATQVSTGEPPRSKRRGLGGDVSRAAALDAFRSALLPCDAAVVADGFLGDRPGTSRRSVLVVGGLEHGTPQVLAAVSDVLRHQRVAAHHTMANVHLAPAVVVVATCSAGADLPGSLCSAFLLSHHLAAGRHRGEVRTAAVRPALFGCLSASAATERSVAHGGREVGEGPWVLGVQGAVCETAPSQDDAADSLLRTLRRVGAVAFPPQVERYLCEHVALLRTTSLPMGVLAADFGAWELPLFVDLLCAAVLLFSDGSAPLPVTVTPDDALGFLPFAVAHRCVGGGVLRRADIDAASVRARLSLDRPGWASGRPRARSRAGSHPAVASSAARPPPVAEAVGAYNPWDAAAVEASLQAKLPSPGCSGTQHAASYRDIHQAVTLALAEQQRLAPPPV